MTENTPATAAEEPSIEEILASIRKIISDEPEAEAAAEPSIPEPEEFEEEEEVLDLSAFVAPEPEAIVEDMELGLEDFNIESAEVFDSFPKHLEANMRMNEPDSEPSIASASTLDAAAAAMAKLQRATEPSYAQSTQLWVGARTIEQVVEDLLRPILKTWLDQNLPQLVERLVEKELSRMSKRLGD